MLTLETLTQADLQLAWEIWYQLSGTTRRRQPAPTVEFVRQSFAAMGSVETVLGMEGYSRGKLRIKKIYYGFSPGHTPICFSAEQRDEDEDAETRAQNRRIAEVIEAAWEDAGLPVGFE